MSDDQEYQGAWFVPGDTLSHLLEAIISDYESERLQYWNVNDESTAVQRFVDAVAETMVSSSDSLVLDWNHQTNNLDWATAKSVIAEVNLSREVRAKAEILLAWRFAATTDEMAKRCVQLAELLLTTRPSDRVLRFVRRLGRCYIAGFYPESIEISRSVLEHVVNEALDARGIFTSANMDKKLGILQNAGAISSEVRKKARTVWQRGNITVHNDPDAIGDALDTIQSALEILELLQSP